MNLVELVTAMAVGLILLLAAALLLDRTTSVSNEISDRQDAVQRGRAAMELITRQLRSQVCLGDASEPITYGDGDRVTFYADLSDGSRSIERRTLRYDPAAKTLTEDVFSSTGVYPDLTFSGTPVSSRTLLTDAEPAREGAVTRPIFRYFGFGSGDLEELPVPLSASDASRTVMVRATFTSLPARLRPRDRDATTLQSDVYVRLADPGRPSEGPRCL